MCLYKFLMESIPYRAQDWAVCKKKKKTKHLNTEAFIALALLAGGQSLIPGGKSYLANLAGALLKCKWDLTWWKGLTTKLRCSLFEELCVFTVLLMGLFHFLNLFLFLPMKLFIILVSYVVVTSATDQTASFYSNL